MLASMLSQHVALDRNTMLRCELRPVLEVSSPRASDAEVFRCLDSTYLGRSICAPNRAAGWLAVGRRSRRHPDRCSAKEPFYS